MLQEHIIRTYQKHVACNYCQRLACVNDNFSKPSKSYLGEDIVDFENASKCWICDIACVDDDVEVRDSAHRVCNIKVSIYVVFHNLEKYDSLFIT